MKKRIEKEEQSLQQSTLRIHDQDNLIRKAVAEFTVTDRKQAPEVNYARQTHSSPGLDKSLKVLIVHL